MQDLWRIWVNILTDLLCPRVWYCTFNGANLEDMVLAALILHLVHLNLSLIHPGIYMSNILFQCIHLILVILPNIKCYNSKF